MFNDQSVMTVMSATQIQSASAAISAKRPRLREVRLQDYAQVAALASKFLLHIEPYPAWVHLWTSNPALREIDYKIPIGWVLEDSQGAISGYLGNVPQIYEFQGNKLLAASTRAWVVESACRTYSPLLLGTYFQQPNVDIFLSTTVTSQSAAAYKTFGGTPVPVGTWDRTLFWITNYHGFTESFLRKRHITSAEALSYPLSVGAFLGDCLKRSRIHTNGRGAPVVACSSLDERFDAFWAALRAIKTNVLLAVRDRETLEWHFKFALVQNWAWIYAVPSNSGLAAYAIFRRHDFEQIGLTRMRLVDFQCLDREHAPNLLESMLHAAMERCRRESIHMLEVVGLPPELEKTLDAASPHRRSISSWLYYFKLANPTLAERLGDPAVWEPSLFDGDSSL
jgi:hypothetical protein